MDGKRIARFVSPLVALALLSSVTSGCVTLSKFDALKERVDALEKENDAQKGPMQDVVNKLSDAIRAMGEEACAEAGVAFLVTDFRDAYPEATRRSRALGMYRQNYCGCLPSMREADAARAARREARRKG